MKQIEVTILGQVYMLGCPDGSESLLRTAVASVDKEMTTIRDAGKVRARERIAVLAALNLAFQLAERRAPTALQVTKDAEVGADAVDIDALVQRVDTALADDAHLL